MQISCHVCWGLYGDDSLALEPKAATHLVLPLILPTVLGLLTASVSWIPHSSAFWLVRRTVTGARLLPSPFRVICTADVSMRCRAHKKRRLGREASTLPAFAEAPASCLLLSELDSLGKKHYPQHYTIGSIPGMSIIMSLGGFSYFVFFLMLFVYLELGHFPCCDSFSLDPFQHWGKSGPDFYFFGCIVYCFRKSIGKLQMI